MNRTLVVYGKTGCSKCDALQRRLEKKNIPFVLRKVDTMEGLVAFCRAEQLNPSRIPAALIEQETGGRREPLRGSTGVLIEQFGTNALPTIVGLQTDYDSGGGVIRPELLDRLGAYLTEG